MFGAHPLGTVPLGAGGPSYPEVRDAIDSADWTGIEQRLESDPGIVRRIKELVGELDSALKKRG